MQTGIRSSITNMQGDWSYENKILSSILLISILFFSILFLF